MATLSPYALRVRVVYPDFMTHDDARRRQLRVFQALLSLCASDTG